MPTIALTEGAYERLQALKRDDESFSEVVVRLTERTDPMMFAGSCPGLGEHVDTDELDDEFAARQETRFR